MMLNVKNHHLYSDKFKLSVIDLNQTELATEEDKVNKIDYWANLFKAKTWEEIKMLAKNNEYLQEAANCLYVANEEEIVRQMCRAREDAERHERTMKRNIALLEEKLKKEKEERKMNEEKLQAENSQRKANEEKLLAENSELKSALSDTQQRIKQLELMFVNLSKTTASSDDKH